MPSELHLLSRWVQPHSPEGLVRELQTEVGPSHPLYGKSARALAVARDRDDILFEVSDGVSVRFAVVHLTWSRRTEQNPALPVTQFFESLENWIEWMKADHDDYTYGEKEQNP